MHTLKHGISLIGTESEATATKTIVLSVSRINGWN